MAFVGHIIGRDGVKLNPAKITAIKKFSRSKTVRAIRQFLNISSYYKKFMRDDAKLAKTLSRNAG